MKNFDKKVLKSLKAAALFALLADSATAQEASPKRSLMLGAFGAGAYNLHSGDFTTYDGVLPCGTFENAQTLGWMAGNILDVPFTDAWGISARLYYHKANGDFSTPSTNPPYILLADSSLVRLNTDQNLNTSLDYVQFDALAKFNFTPVWYMTAGPSIGFATRAAYSQEESIVSPTGAKFESGGTSRKIIAGRFEDEGSANTEKNLRVAAVATFGADFPLTNRIYLNPEIGYQFGFTNVLSSFSWKVDALRAGVGVKFAFSDETVIIEKPAPPADVPPAPRPAPVVALDVQSVLKDGSRLNYGEIVIREEITNELQPLLPYVFFKANDAVIPERYALFKTPSAFDESSLQEPVLGVYHHVLNIIGSRLQKNPAATITVTGTVEPLDDNAASSTLARNRAEAVRDYLLKTWNIAVNRISIRERQLPEVISNRAEADGREENRRVEITSDFAEILAPVKLQRRTISREPEALLLVPKMQFAEEVASWSATISDGGNTLWNSKNTGAPGEIAWNFKNDDVKNLRDGSSLLATLDVKTLAGDVLKDTRPVAVKHTITSRRFNGEIVRDSIIERYNLMFFDFDTPRISAFNTQVISLIQSRLKTSSSLRITGLTDRIGADAYNLKLSEGRAKSAENAIKARIVPETISTTGRGEDLIYDNDLPEGRFYNRTVIIEVATPLE
ncbi:MAG TPA: OmpA family protein [Patescibacteria group bacterium]|nr:OmpA family protein [Patescibacteria group bacterium]